MRIVDGAVLSPALNACSVRRDEDFVVYEVARTGQPAKLIETQPTASKAAKASVILNDHAARTGYAGRYSWAFAKEEY